jgi:catechol 2,3-dioxygenase-like lactoylglutathione lyase family enzyme
MIDHVSIAVRDLDAAVRFYEAVLGAIGLSKLIAREGTVGFGKRYPEFWLNSRPEMTVIDRDSGVHICLRVPDTAAVDAFHAAALRQGGTSDGAPGPRPEYTAADYARDPDGNRIEAVTFMQPSTCG